MTQRRMPQSYAGAGWTGAVAALSDMDDSTYLASPASPTIVDPCDVTLDLGTDPGGHEGWVLHVEVRKDHLGGSDCDLLLEVLNGDDLSLIASRQITPITSDVVAVYDLALTAAEMIKRHPATALKVRVTGKGVTQTAAAGANTVTLSNAAATVSARISRGAGTQALALTTPQAGRTTRVSRAAGSQAVMLTSPTAAGSTGGGSSTLLTETFEDASFAARGWYDGTAATVTSAEHHDGANCVAAAFTVGEPSPWYGMRHLFTPTNSVYLSFWVKHSANWVGSGLAWHPHLFYLMTTADANDWVGPNSAPVVANCEIGWTTNATGGYTHMVRGGAVDPSGTWYSPATPSIPEATKNNWHHVEYYLVLNSANGAADGIAQVWVDNTRVLNRSDVVYRPAGYPTMQFNKLLLGPYMEGSNGGSPVNQTMWLDGLTLGVERPAAALSVTGLSPSSGTTAGGTPLTITGTGFVAGATVTVGGTAATSVVVVSATSITCVTPAHAAGSVDVVVTVGGETASTPYTYAVLGSTPTITAVSGTVAPGNTLTISGSTLMDEDTSHYQPFHTTYPNAARFAGASLTADGWMDTGGGTYVSNVTLLGTHSAFFTITGAGLNQDRGDAVYTYNGKLELNQTLNFRAYYRCTATGGWPLNRFKTFYLQAPNHGIDYVLGSPGAPWGPNCAFVDDGHGIYGAAYPDGNLTSGRWYCLEMQLARPSNVLTAWIDGRQVFSRTMQDTATWEMWIAGIPGGTDGDVGMILNVWLGAMAFGTAAGGRLYPLTTVEIGDNATYANATKRYQAPTLITDSQVQVRCDLTGLPASGPLWLFVTNNQQVTSAGYQIRS